MRVLVCGGRNYADKLRVYSILDQYHAQHTITCLISGEARGADTLAEQWALERKVKFEGYRANWKLYGRGAGPIRNVRMLEVGKPDLVIAFPGGRGTANMIAQARRAQVEVQEIVP